MKRLILLSAATISLTAAALGQYSVERFKVAGGGGTSTGGVFVVSGTIGQPDAGAMSGGNFSLLGGFWGAVIPVQQAGGPTLFIVNLQNGSVKLTWQPNTPGFVLQEAAGLSPVPVAWTNAPAAYTNGATISAAPQTRYFRLNKP